MGNGFTCHCKACAFTVDALVGIGMLYPSDCKEILEDMKNGKYGWELQYKAKYTRNIAIHHKRAIFLCDNCGSWRADDIIDLCVPAPPVLGEGTFKNRHTKKYIMDFEIGEAFCIIDSVEQKCSCCQESMRAIEKPTAAKLRKKLKCPNCKGELECFDSIMWD